MSDPTRSILLLDVDSVLHPLVPRRDCLVLSGKAQANPKRQLESQNTDHSSLGESGGADSACSSVSSRSHWAARASALLGISGVFDRTRLRPDTANP